MRSLMLALCILILPQLANGSPINIQFDGTLSEFSCGCGDPDFNAVALFSDIGAFGDMFNGNITLDPENESYMATLSVTINGAVFTAGSGLNYDLIDDVTGDFFLNFRDFRSVAISSPVRLSDLDIRITFFKNGGAGTVSEFPSEFDTTEWGARFRLLGRFPELPSFFNASVGGAIANISTSPIATVNSPQTISYFASFFLIYVFASKYMARKR